MTDDYPFGIPHVHGSVNDDSAPKTTAAKIRASVKRNQESRAKQGLPEIDYRSKFRKAYKEGDLDKFVGAMDGQSDRIHAQRAEEIRAIREPLIESAKFQPSNTGVDWKADAERERDRRLEAAYTSGDQRRINEALIEEGALAEPASMLPRPKLVDDELADGFTLEQLKVARQAKEDDLAEWRDRKDPHHQDDPDRQRGLD